MDTQKDYTHPGLSLGLSSACPPHSALRTLASSSPTATKNKNKTLIYNHTLQKDPCNSPRPSHFAMHGFYVNKKNEEPMKEIGSPMMSVCSTSMHGDIVIPNLSRRRYADEAENVEWSDKIDEVS